MTRTVSSDHTLRRSIGGRVETWVCSCGEPLESWTTGENDHYNMVMALKMFGTHVDAVWAHGPRPPFREYTDLEITLIHELNLVENTLMNALGYATEVGDDRNGGLPYFQSGSYTPSHLAAEASRRMSKLMNTLAATHRGEAVTAVNSMIEQAMPSAPQRAARRTGT